MSYQRMLSVFDFSYQSKITAQDLDSSLLYKKLGVLPTHIFTVPANVYLLQVTACGGGAAGGCANLQTKVSGCGGAAGFVKTVQFSVIPGQRFEIFVGCGGKYQSTHEPLTTLQIEQKVFEIIDAQDTIVYDCKNDCVAILANGGKGFCGGRGVKNQQFGENGVASLENRGSGCCDPSGKWIGYGGSGGGGRFGGKGGCGYSNRKTTKAENAPENSGCGGGGSALLLNDANKHFLPGSGASGYVHIQYDR